MRFSVLLGGLSTCLMLAAPFCLSQAIADDMNTCSFGSADEAIAACTRAINSGRLHGNNLSAAYSFRSWAFSRKGDRDHELADLNEAIRLNSNWLNLSIRAREYLKSRDYDHAIADFNEAIRLAPKSPSDAVQIFSIASLHSDRGRAYYGKDDYDHAISDYTETLRIDPSVKETYIHIERGNVYVTKGDYDDAIADYSEYIVLNPKASGVYLSRGMAYFYAGALPKALADLNQASSLDPKSAYAALWLDIVAQRNNVQSQLSEAISKIDMTTWPAPVIRMFLGQMTPAAVLAAADDPDATKKKGQICIANYFIGEWMLRQDATEEATRLLRLASPECDKHSTIVRAAEAELKALRVAP